MRRGTATLCRACGAVDSLVQDVRAEVSGNRPVRLEGPEGALKVAFGPEELETFDAEIIETEAIKCNRCKKEWADADDLFDIGPPKEHRCTDCEWWGYNDFNHGLQRPDCVGLVYRADKPPAEVAA